MRVYNVIDLSKFIFSFFIVLIHCEAYAILDEKICRLAVPCFFIFSGFFLYKGVAKPDGGIQYLNSYLGKLVRLYLLYTIIYLPLTIYGALPTIYQYGFEGFVKKIVAFFRNVCFVGENYMSWPLWYLLALIVAIFMIKCFLKRKIQLLYIFFISLTLTLIGLYVDYLNNSEGLPSFVEFVLKIYNSVFVTTRNGIFVGLFYVTVGMIISKYELFITTNKLLILILFVISLSGYYFNLILGLNIFASVLVCVLLMCNGLFKEMNNNLAKTFRKMSTVVYFFHMYFIFIFSNLFYNIPREKGIMIALISFVSAALLGLLIIKLSQQKKFSFLKYLLT